MESAKHDAVSTKHEDESTIPKWNQRNTMPIRRNTVANQRFQNGISETRCRFDETRWRLNISKMESAKHDGVLTKQIHFFIKPPTRSINC